MKFEVQYTDHFGREFKKLSKKYSSLKSGGARIITHIYYSGKIVYLLSIFDKSEKESLTDGEIIELIRNLDL